MRVCDLMFDEYCNCEVEDGVEIVISFFLSFLPFSLGAKSSHFVRTERVEET